MSFAPESVSFDRGDGSILGCFTEKDCGNLFEFSAAPDLYLAPPAHGGKNVVYPHLVWVTTPWKHDCGYRRARVLKNVVHIITDEDENGWAVVEKWNIKNYREYSA